MAKKKRSLKERIDSYSNFYKRAMSDKDIDDILEQGGQTSLENFKSASKSNTASGYWEAMFQENNGNLGKEIFQRYVKDGTVTQNSANRIVVRGGEKITFNGKDYKGGQFLPRNYFARRTNRKGV